MVLQDFGFCHLVVVVCCCCRIPQHVLKELEISHAFVKLTLTGNQNKGIVPTVDGSEIPNNHRLDGAKALKITG